jgi:hypothetical protein
MQEVKLLYEAGKYQLVESVHLPEFRIAGRFFVGHRDFVSVSNSPMIKNLNEWMIVIPTAPAFSHTSRNNGAFKIRQCRIFR